MSDVVWPCGCSYTKGDGVTMCDKCNDEVFGDDPRSKKEKK